VTSSIRSAGETGSGKPPCSVAGCPHQTHVVGLRLCPSHYSRLQRWGDVRPDLPFGGLSFGERFWAKVDQRGENECWPWMASCTAGGYGQVALGGTGKRGRSLTGYAHRVAYGLANGSVPSTSTALRVLHHCDNPPCCNPAHLYLGTQKDNARDREARGRGGGAKMRGEDNYSAKLTRAQVDEIRRRADEGLAYGGRKALLEEFGIGSTTFYRIVRRTHWR